jgi:hypothetical protein
MAEKPSIIETRRPQIFPLFSESELQRLQRFGMVREYLIGATLVSPGKPTDGLLFILSGAAAVTVRGASGDAQCLTGAANDLTKIRVVRASIGQIRAVDRGGLGPPQQSGA